MKNKYLHRLYGRSRLARRIAMNMRANMEFASLGGHKDGAVIGLISRVRRERESLLSGNEAFLVYSLARAQSALRGEMAEVGVYQGCSAKLISTANEGRTLHLFDTFEGLPEPDTAEQAFLRRNQYSSSIDSVRRYLAGQNTHRHHRVRMQSFATLVVNCSPLSVILAMRLARSGSSLPFPFLQCPATFSEPLVSRPEWADERL